MITKEQRAEIRMMVDGMTFATLCVDQKPSPSTVQSMLDALHGLLVSLDEMERERDAAIEDSKALRAILDGVSGHFLEKQGDDAEIGGEILEMSKECATAPISYDEVRRRMSVADECGDS
jgi:hypothetical protein